MALKTKSNVESFDNLLLNLKDYHVDFTRIPFVILLNKVDLARENIPLISSTGIKKELLSRAGHQERKIVEAAPVFETSAVTGENVLKGLEAIIRLTVNRLDFDAMARRD
jgi:GTPase SAR1 family protein